MAREKSKQLTAVERRIMNILWTRGPSSVREIAAALSEEKPTAYTSAQTMCKILAEKGYASFSKAGRAFIYKAEVSKNEAQRGALKTMLDQFFGGSPQVLAQHMMQENDLSSADLDELQKLIDQSKKTRE